MSHCPLTQAALSVVVGGAHGSANGGGQPRLSNVVQKSSRILDTLWFSSATALASTL